MPTNQTANETNKIKTENKAKPKNIPKQNQKNLKQQEQQQQQQQQKLNKENEGKRNLENRNTRYSNIAYFGHSSFFP